MSEEKKEKLDKTQQQNEQIEEMGQVLLEENEKSIISNFIYYWRSRRS